MTPPTDGFGGVVAGADLRLRILARSLAHGFTLKSSEVTPLSGYGHAAHQPAKNIWAKVLHVVGAFRRA